MHPVSPEYRGARRVLLDALTALEPQLPSLILVGAQAIYLHAGQTEVGIATAPTTTDSDLAVDAELLAAEPEMTGALTAAGFSTPTNPGSWVSPDGVAIDLMVCPHQANRAGRGARSARLPPHGNRLARITRGLEPALVDHSTVRLIALDITDSRSVPLKVAGPAALVTAKLIKLQERFDDVNTAKPDRVRGKDVTDIFRLLVATESDVLQNGFAIHQQLSQAATVTDQALEFAAAIEGSAAVRGCAEYSPRRFRVILCSSPNGMLSSGTSDNARVTGAEDLQNLTIDLVADAASMGWGDRARARARSWMSRAAGAARGSSAT